MKLQHMTIIFLAIMIPMILVLSAYIQMQSKSIVLQTQYDTKLLDATHDAVAAFQLNSSNNNYATIANSKRRDILASAKTFTNSIATNFGISGTKQEDILKFVPALLYTLNDGYYIYAPSNVNGTYEHTLKSFIYYSTRYKSGNTDVVINYSLDNYIVVEGVVDGNYVSKAGYLINLDRVIKSGGSVTGYNTAVGPISLDGIEMVTTFNENGYYDYNYDDWEKYKQYYQEAYEFTSWIMSTSLKNLTPSNAVTATGGQYKDFSTDVSTQILNINNSNDPENKESNFNQHRMKVIRLSIEENLSNAIANYNKKTGILGTFYNFKMPILSEEDWEKISNNVTISAFMQGVPVGGTIYNNYAIGISTENNENVNPETFYFTNGSAVYHKLNCPELINNIYNYSRIVGYKPSVFSKSLNSREDGYYYKHRELACYHCVVNSEVEDASIESINNSSLTPDQKKALATSYYKAVGRERKNLYKISEYVNEINN